MRGPTAPTATLALYRGPAMGLSDYPTVDAAIAAADDAVSAGTIVLAVVRDDNGVMQYACDASGRFWRPGPGRHGAEVAGMGVGA